MTTGLIDRDPRRLGDAFKVAPLGLGCWRLVARPDDELRAVIETGLDLGMNLVDTADVYGLDWGGSSFGEAEANLGRILAGAPQLRDRMVLATKGGIVPATPYDSSCEAITAACEASLRRLGVDVIDLYQIHRPDLFTHPAELAEALSGLRASGKIREVGVSNFTPAQHEALAAHLPFALASTQPQYSAAHLDPLSDGTFDLCMRAGVLPLVWSPLGGGRLAGDAHGAGGAGASEPLVAVLDRLAAREGVDRAAAALAFVLAHPARPVALLGTQQPSRLVKLAEALGVHLDRSDLYDVIEASQGAPMP
ncbi:MAG: aldo/keto reductase [Acidimicrobiaceae bacterium]|nr:aldo/keto reductase [Acidimicrobiaceae bacterium]MCY4176772.1 aldo/keto reductase [Acidimicrobiaceae bacterium]MCY4280964.1 aldo/keto reductase [Acidimicrobiaceae bacterium]MCY4295160.1 aldo/keto reductase [Acidimicrobiaceae bacterium]